MHFFPSLYTLCAIQFIWHSYRLDLFIPNCESFRVWLGWNTQHTQWVLAGRCPCSAVWPRGATMCRQCGIMETNSSIKHIARRAGSSTDVMEEDSVLIKTHDLSRQEQNYSQPMQQSNLGRSQLQKTWSFTGKLSWTLLFIWILKCFI